MLASILVVASCEKPTGEAPKASVEDTSGKTSEPSREDTSEEAPAPSGEDAGGEAPAPKQWHVSTLAGSTDGHKDAAGTDAQFNFPDGIAVSSDGNTLYVTDSSNHRIKKIDISSKKVTTIAGSIQGYADAPSINAQFNFPNGIAVSSDGNTLYVVDKLNHRIRKIGSWGEVTTIAGGTQGHADARGINAQFDTPYGIAVTSDGTLYVTDTGNRRIKKINASGVVTTIAGGTDARLFSRPRGIAVSSDGTLYVADSGPGRHYIRKIDASGVVTTIAGGTQGHADARGINAQFDTPYGIAVSSDGNTLYVADTQNNRIRKVALPSGEVTTIAGSTRGDRNATGTDAQFNAPYSIAVSSDGTLYVADSANHRIRKIEFK